MAIGVTKTVPYAPEERQGSTRVPAQPTAIIAAPALPAWRRFCAGAVEDALHYLLTYDVVSDYVTRRAPLRAAHIALARAAVAKGDLVLGGALGNPPDAVALLFQGDSPAAAEAFARDDPYVQNGLVTG